MPRRKRLGREQHATAQSFPPAGYAWKLTVCRTYKAYTPSITVRRTYKAYAPSITVRKTHKVVMNGEGQWLTIYGGLTQPHAYTTVQYAYRTVQF